MSIGALVDEALAAEYEAAKREGVHVLLPSGAIAGLDGIRALASEGTLQTVNITTTKAPAGLRGAPYLEQRGLVLPEGEAFTVFEGSAREAVAGFPSNVNVAIALSLAGLGPDATKVRIVSDPRATVTKHEVAARSETTSIEVRIESTPSPGNPRTSSLAAASAVAALREAVSY